MCADYVQRNISKWEVSDGESDFFYVFFLDQLASKMQAKNAGSQSQLCCQQES